jgi:predicted unusual protein kinase regulating ubiquinone biosynthesis (AarF/ABC1/UbiB family)
LNLLAKFPRDAIRAKGLGFCPQRIPHLNDEFVEELIDSEQDALTGTFSRFEESVFAVASIANVGDRAFIFLLEILR